MRRSTALLASILLILVALAALFLIGGTLSARVSAVTAGAEAHPQAFESIQRVLAAGAEPQRFAEGLSGEAADYRLEDVTIHLANRGLVAAEWLYVEAEGAPGDIAVYSVTGEGGGVAARSSGSVNLKLISRKGVSGERVYHIQYYVYGMKRTVDVRQAVSE